MYELDRRGWVHGVRRIESPNFDSRPAEVVPDLLVVHAISLPPDQFGGDGVERLFTNRLDPAEHPYYAGIHHLQVSAHFFIRRDAELIQFVSAHDRAWHAGLSRWADRERCNDFSIGIELEGCDTKPFETGQYECLANLAAGLRRVFRLSDIVGHSDIAPGRKTDPGPFFEWSRFHVLLSKVERGT